MHRMYQYILFDLDGTLTNSKSGITRCVQYALEDAGIIETDLDKLECFIGPPLLDSFMEFYHMDEQTANKAVVKYRERFSTTGLYENEVYPGIPELLQALKQQGYTLAVATSKPEHFALRILDYFELSPYFDKICGAYDNHNAKDLIIGDAIIALEVKDLSKVLMVGDRKHDILGAKANHIDSAGLRIGFAPEKELEEAGADYVFDTPKDLQDFLTKEQDDE